MKSVMTHQFSQAPTADIPRSSFDRSHGYKTTFDAGRLVPVFVDEVLPGDTFTVRPTMFARLNTPIYPIMDNMFLDIHFFFVPYRQIWENFRKFCGERASPAASTDFTIPQISFSSNITTGSIWDYMGLPIGGQPSISALPFRAYRHIYNEWYRDQNIIAEQTVGLSDAATVIGGNSLPERRGKRHDYFTSCLPWLQKGDAVDIPLGTSAPVTTDALANVSIGVYSNNASDYITLDTDGSAGGHVQTDEGSTVPAGNRLFADLTNATAATINELRRAFQIQKLLERDARSGTRYAEIVNAHFGVQFMDVTYRPEFLGGSSTPINISQIPQTSATEAGLTAQGTLAAYGTATIQGGGFTKSFTEHGLVMGIASVRADLTYQQGIERFWSRSTRYDFYWPALAHIGEQSVLNQELYYQGTSADTDVFGYQERWAEYRYKPSRITGLMRSDAANSLDAWHLSQDFSALPSLDPTFIEEDPPIDRVVAVTTEPDFLMDCYFDMQCARPMPLYSVPGLIDHF